MTAENAPTLPTPTSERWNVQRLWRIFLEPHPSIPEGKRLPAIVLAALLLVMNVVSLVTVLSWGIINISQTGQSSAFAASVFQPHQVLSVLAIFVAYFLGRSRYFAAGAIVTISVMLFFPVAQALQTAFFPNPLLFVPLLAVVLAGLMLSLQSTVVTGVIAVLVIILGPLVAPDGDTDTSQKFTAILLTADTAALMAASTVIRERYLRQLRDARVRAENSDRVKSAFLASMSHELRTPLNAVINLSKFVAEGDLGPITDEQKEALHSVVGSAKHLLSLINDVLDMSKIESGSLNLFVEDNVDLESILESVTAVGKTLIGDKPIELRTEIAPDLPRIRADRQRIFQVMLNIMSNACKFTEHGVIELRAHAEGSQVLLSVKDTGPGIPREDQGLVFEAFKQTNTGLRHGGGTGLGMPISRNLINAHGGRLWLESAPGEGSTFYVSLPTQSTMLTPIQMTKEYAA